MGHCQKILEAALVTDGEVGEGSVVEQSSFVELDDPAR
jgi:hypothetical protein